MDVQFSRKNLGEFVRTITPEVTRIDISLSAEKDEAIIFIPFSRNAIVVHTGETVVIGEIVEGSIPPRHVIEVQSI